MPRGIEYSDGKRAAALIMFLIFKSSHSDVEAKTGVSKTAIRQLSSRAHKAGVDRTSIEELIVFARTKPRKGRPRKDGAAAIGKGEKVVVVKTGRQEGEGAREVGEGDVVVSQEGRDLRERPVDMAAAVNTRTADGEDLFEIIKSWEQHKGQTIDASYAAVAREQG